MCAQCAAIRAGISPYKSLVLKLVNSALRIPSVVKRTIDAAEIDIPQAVSEASGTFQRPLTVGSSIRAGWRRCQLERRCWLTRQVSSPHPASAPVAISTLCKLGYDAVALHTHDLLLVLTLQVCDAVEAEHGHWNSSSSVLQSKAILAFDYPSVGWRSSRGNVEHGWRVREAVSCHAGRNAAAASMSEAAALDVEAWSMVPGHGMT